jgi:hypothetical protein
MIAWIVGIVTLLLLLFVLWRGRSRAFRERAEEPKYLFLESLGISAPRKVEPAKSQTSEEKKDESAKS